MTHQTPSNVSTVVEEKNMPSCVDLTAQPITYHRCSIRRYIQPFTQLVRSLSCQLMAYKAVSLMTGVLALFPWQTAQAENALQQFQVGKYEQALPQLKKLADSGKSQALYDLGLIKLQGYGQAADTQQGLALIRRAANKGWRPAQWFMGKYALDVKNNPKEAFQSFLRAAKQGDKKAMFFVAGCYQNGFGTAKNPSLARRYLIKAAKAGITNAEYYWGKQFIDKSNRRSQKLGRVWLTKAARKNSPPAMAALASYYQQNYSKQQRWLKKLQQHKTAQSSYLLGKFYLSQPGIDIKEDGLVWLKKAAEQRYAPALYTLSIMHQDGDIEPIDDKLAFRELTVAAKANYIPAQKRLSILYEQGIGTAKDPKTAKYWQSQSSGKSYPVAKQQLVNWLGAGNPNAPIVADFTYNGVNKDWQATANQLTPSPRMKRPPASALFSNQLEFDSPTTIATDQLLHSAQPLKVYQATEVLDFPNYPIENQYPSKADIKRLYGSALLGNREAQFRLGQYHQQGIGVDQNNNAAAQWYFSAAKQNHLPSEYALGLLFLYGKGVEQNLKKASYWLNSAAFKGNVESQYALATIYQHGYSAKNGSDYIPANSEQSIGMYSLASGAGNAKAKYQLAMHLAQIPLREFSSAYERRQHHATIKSLLEQANQAGITAAQMPLAIYLADDNATPQQQRWAFNTLNQSEYQDIPAVSLAIALMYERGIGTQQNMNKAINWYRKASDNGIPAAHFALGSYLYLGEHLSPSKQQAVQFLSRAAQAGLPYASYNLAVIHSDLPSASDDYLRQSAAGGYSKAALFGADRAVLTNQSDTKKKTVATYQHLAKKGNEKAQWKLGYLYEHGIFVPADRRQARRYYQMAAQKQDPIAAYHLAHLYQTDKPTESRLALARKWYKQAARQGYVPAMLALGFIEETHYHNYPQAINWYRQAAQQGEPIAHYNLGLLSVLGKGRVLSTSQAIQHLTKAANAKDAQAQYLLGQQYLEGKQPNRQMAFFWIDKSAENGLVEAKRQLGLLYETGTGTSPNFTKSRQLYRQAANQGDKIAKQYLARVAMMTSNDTTDLTSDGTLATAAKSGDKFASFQLAKRYLTEPSHAKEGKAIIKQLSKKGYQPAVALTKYIDEKNKLATVKAKVAKQKETNHKPQKTVTFNPYTLLTLKMKPINVDNPPSMQRAAIRALDQGDYYQAQAILEKIVALHPDYLPASRLLALFKLDANQYYSLMTAQSS